MKFWRFIALLCSTAAIAEGAALGGGGEERVTIVIRADGTGAATNATVQPRAVAEQTARMWQRYLKNLEGADTDAAPAKPNNKPMTDEELRAAVIEGAKTTAEQSGLERRLEHVQITSNELRTVWSQRYSSLSEFAGQSQMVLAQAGFTPENVRLESTNGQLRITLVASPQMARYAKTMRTRMNAMKGKAELIWILPGKVLSSTLPDTSGNVTSIRFTSDDPKSLDAFFKNYISNVVITAELNGLKLDRVIESKSLQREMFGQQETGGGLPITDAGPGFVSEAVSVTTSTLTLFPEGEKIFKDTAALRFQTGAVVRAKLFPPKGRSILSATEVRVTKATDDKGRAVSGENDAEMQMRRSFRSFSSDGDEKSPAAEIELKLGLPAADADAVAELNAQAVVVTVGSWKEFSITNLQINATNTFDLGTILPGAKLTVKKVTSRRQQLTVEAQLTGPTTVGDLDLQCRQPGAENFSSYANNRRSTTTASQTTRNVHVQCSNYGEEPLKPENLVLVVRAPTDLRRERVQIKLSNLDLL